MDLASQTYPRPFLHGSRQSRPEFPGVWLWSPKSLLHPRNHSLKLGQSLKEAAKPALRRHHRWKRRDLKATF